MNERVRTERGWWLKAIAILGIVASALATVAALSGQLISIKESWAKLFPSEKPLMVALRDVKRFGTPYPGGNTLGGSAIFGFQIEAVAEKSGTDVVRCFGELALNEGNHHVNSNFVLANDEPNDMLEFAAGDVKRIYYFNFTVPIDWYSPEGAFRLVCNSKNIITDWSEVKLWSKNVLPQND